MGLSSQTKEVIQNASTLLGGLALTYTAAHCHQETPILSNVFYLAGIGVYMYVIIRVLNQDLKL
jgi:hypothetical protein